MGKMKGCLIFIVIIVAALIALGSCSNDDSEKDSGNSTTSNNTQQNSKDENKDKKEEKTDNKVNYENFLKIEMGSSYQDVVTLIGEGKEQTSSETNGMKTIIYTWNGDGISNMNVTIQQDKVVAKAQAGLESMDAGITLEKYDTIKEGMTYSEIKEILGEGQLVSVTKILDIKSEMYSYVNKDGSNANFTFSSDSLSVKAQFGLE